MTAETIQTRDEFERLITNEAVIIHIDVNWSGYAVQARPLVLRVRELIAQKEAYADVVFRRIDLSDQSGEMWDTLKEWFRNQPSDGTVMFSGYGAIVWVRSGRVVGEIHYAAHTGVESLVSRTVTAFGEPDREQAPER